jgi:cytochrome c-type biogenesis protein CcmH/NrfG
MSLSISNRRAVLAALLGAAAAVGAAMPGRAQTSPSPESAVVLIRTMNSLRSTRGSGFAVGDGSWIVTASHVVAVDLGKGRRAWDKTALVYSPWTGRPYEARVAAVDPAADLALLRLPMPGLPALWVEGLDLRDAGIAATTLGNRKLRLYGFPLSYGEDTVASLAKPEHNDSTLKEITRRGETSLCVLGTCPDAQPGWSGGPILAADKGTVVAVFHSLYKASSRSDGYPAGSICGYLGDLLKQAGAGDMSIFANASSPTIPRPADGAERMAREMRTLSLSAAGNWKRAEEEQRALLKSDPQDPYARTELGKILLEQERFDEALTELRAAARLNPKSVVTACHLGRALHFNFDPKGAAEVLRGATQFSPGEIEPLMLLAEIQEANQKPDEAEATLRSAIQASPEHPAALYRLGMLINTTARAEEAKKLLAQAADLALADPALSYIPLGYARSLEAARKNKEAEEMYRRAVKSDPQNALALFYFSQFYLKLNRVEDAQAQLNQAILLPRLSDRMLEALRALQTRINEKGGGIDPK